MTPETVTAAAAAPEDVMVRAQQKCDIEGTAVVGRTLRNIVDYDLSAVRGLLRAARMREIEAPIETPASVTS